MVRDGVPNQGQIAQVPVFAIRNRGDSHRLHKPSIDIFRVDYSSRVSVEALECSVRWARHILSAQFDQTRKERRKARNVSKSSRKIPDKVFHGNNAEEQSECRERSAERDSVR